MLGCDNELLFGKAELKVLVDLLSPGGMGGKDELTFDEVLIIKVKRPKKCDALTYRYYRMSYCFSKLDIEVLLLLLLLF